LFIPVIEITQVKSEALKNSTFYKNCLGCKGLRARSGTLLEAVIIYHLQKIWVFVNSDAFGEGRILEQKEIRYQMSRPEFVGDKDEIREWTMDVWSLRKCSGGGEPASLIVHIPLATSRGDLSSSGRLLITSERA
jgi:hypothetical protein